MELLMAGILWIAGFGLSLVWHIGTLMLIVLFLGYVWLAFEWFLDILG